MKTLLFTLEYPPFKGGVSNYYENLVNFWPDKENIKVLNNNDGKLLNGSFWPKWRPAIRKLKNEIKKESIEHIIVGQLLPLGTATYLVTKKTKTPYTVILHGMDVVFATRKGRKKRISQKVLNKAKNIICVSSYTKKITIENFGKHLEKKITIVNPGIRNNIRYNQELSNKLKRQNNLENKIILFSIGRLVKRKGFDMTIDAMKQVIRSNNNIRYVIAGDGPDRKYLEDKIKSNFGELATEVILVGSPTDEEKWAWLNLSDVFITPSRNINGDFEGFGIVYLEAGLMKKPVIAGDSGGIKDAVQGAVTGFLVDPKRPDKIADVILRLASDHNLRIKMGEAGKKRAIEHFNWEKQINKIYNIIT